MAFVTVYIPHNENTEHLNWVNHTLHALSQVAGGATATDGTGAWINDDGHLEVEPVTLVRALCTEDELPDVWRAAEIVADLLLNVGEQAVAIETNHSLHLLREVR